MSAGAFAGAPRAEAQTLWCWACDTESDFPSTTTEVVCGNCGSGAVEERVTARASNGFTPPRLAPMQAAGRGASAFLAAVRSDGAPGGRGERSPQREDAGAEGGAPAGAAAEDNEEEDDGLEGDDLLARIRGLLLRRVLLSMLTGENNGEEGAGAGGSLAALMGGGTLVAGDYAVGDLGPLIAQLGQNDPGKTGPPCTAARVLEALREVDGASVDASEDCTVCQDPLIDREKDGSGSSGGSGVLKLPMCRHSFHSACLTPWLQQHNMCPVCRAQMPTDDGDYNAQHGLDITKWLADHGT